MRSQAFLERCQRNFPVLFFFMIGAMFIAYKKRIVILDSNSPVNPNDKIDTQYAATVKAETPNANVVPSPTSHEFEAEHQFKRKPATTEEVYDYLMNITAIKEKSLRIEIYKTLKSKPYKNDIYLEDLKDSWPCVIPKELRISYPGHTVDDTPVPLLLTKPSGRLGNLLGHYAKLYAMNKLYDIPVYMSNAGHNKMHTSFPHLTMPILTKDRVKRLKCIALKNPTISNSNVMEAAASGLMGPRCFSMAGGPIVSHLFDPFKEEIKNEFKFSDEIQKKVSKFFHKIKTSKEAKRANKDSNSTFVGIHVRRTDYVRFMKKFGTELPPDNYVLEAMNYYRRELLKDPIFVASSDDMKYLKCVLANETSVFFTPGKNAEEDLAILMSCDHSIFTVGTYGFWSAYLTPGKKAYPDIATKYNYRLSKRFYEKAHLDDFIPITFV